MNRILRQTMISIMIESVVFSPWPEISYADSFSSAVGDGKNLGRELSGNFEDLFRESTDNINEDDSSGIKGFEADLHRNRGNFDYQAVTDAGSGAELEKLSLEKKRELYSSGNSGNGDGSSAAYRIITDTRKNVVPVDLSEDPVARRSRDIYASIDKAGADAGFGDCSRKISYRTSGTKNHVPKLVHCNRLVDRSNECTLSHELSVEPVISLVKADSDAHDVSNFMNIRPCSDENCFEVWLGSEYRDSRNWCTAYHDYLYIKVDHPEAVTGVFLSYVQWDDYMALYIGGKNSEELLFNTTGTLPIRLASVTDTVNPEAQSMFLSGRTVYVDRINGDAVVARPGCENKGEDCYRNRCNRGRNLMQGTTVSGTDLTSLFRSAADPENPIVFHSLTSTADAGNYQAKLKIYYDPALIVHTDAWTPADCLESAQSIGNGFTSGALYCDQTFSGVSFNESRGENCLHINGISLCENELRRSSPVADLSPFCRNARVNSVTTYYRSEDDHENYRLDGCEKYRGKCSFVSSKCSAGAEDNAGNCYDFEEIYDCGTDFDDQSRIADISYDCGGTVRCIGSECVDTSYDISDGYARAAALLNAVQFMGQDMECTGLDARGNPVGDVDVVCRVFAGNARDCAVSMKGLGGLEVNCCESPGGITPSEYISALMALPKIDSMIARTGPASPIYGAYNAIREPVFNGIARISNTLGDVTRPFTSWLENNFGITNTTTAGAGQTGSRGIMDAFTDMLKEKAKEIIKKIIVRAQTSGIQGAGEAGGTAAATEEATAQIEAQAEKQAAAAVEGLSTALSVVGYVYMTYQIACLASQMIFKCRDEQIALAAAKELGNCSYVGQYCSKKVMHTCIQKTYSYCCYSSPLSRIIQEQVHEQLGMPIGSLNPKSPDCGGITIDQLEHIDWSAVDLSEWVALLKITGNFTDASDIDAERLTGSRSRLNLDYTGSSLTNITETERKNVMERTAERIFDIDTDRVNFEVNRSTAISADGSVTGK